VGPLTTLLIIFFLTGCTYTTSQLNAELQDSMITSGEKTTIHVTVKNPYNKTFKGHLESHSESEQVQITYPDESNLDLTLYQDEEVKRVFTVNAESNTRRTDYELTITLMNESDTIANKTNVLSVTR